MDLNKKIRILREKSGFSQSALADYLGITTEDYINMEEGTITIKFGTVHKLSALYCLPLNKFLYSDSTETPLQAANRDGWITPEDLHSIGHVNRIALNSHEMSKISEDLTDTERELYRKILKINSKKTGLKVL